MWWPSLLGQSSFYCKLNWMLKPLQPWCTHNLGGLTENLSLPTTTDFVLGVQTHGVSAACSDRASKDPGVEDPYFVTSGSFGREPPSAS